MNRIFTLLLASLLFSFASIKAQKFDKIDQLLFSEQFKEAIPLLEAKIKKDSSNYKNHFRLGKVYQHLNQYKKASDELQKAYNLHPESKSIALSLGGSLYNLGNYPAAEKVMLNYCEMDSTNYQANILLAKIYYTQSYYKKSLKVYQQLNKKDSLNAYIYKQIANIKSKTNDHMGALGAYQKAYELNPNDLSVLLHLIQSCYDITAYRGALQYANEGLEQYPNHPLILKKKAQVLIGAQWYENALTILKDLETNGNLKLPDYKQLGICFMQTKKYHEAIAAFLKVGEAFDIDKDPMINFYLGVCYSRTHQIAKGIKHLEAAIVNIVPPIKADIHLQLAKSYNNNREFKKAVEHFKKNFEMDGKNPVVLYEIATTYEEFGNNKKEALEYYTKFMHRMDDKTDKKYEYAKARVLHLKEAMHFEK